MCKNDKLFHFKHVEFEINAIGQYNCCTFWQSLPKHPLPGAIFVRTAFRYKFHNNLLDNRILMLSSYLMACSATLVLIMMPHAHGAEDPALAAAKAAHAEIIGPAPGPRVPAAIESRRPGNATPDEVAARIAVRLAQLRVREAARKSEPKPEPKRVRQENVQPRPALPATGLQTVGTRQVQCERSFEYTSI